MEPYKIPIIVFFSVFGASVLLRCLCILAARKKTPRVNNPPQSPPLYYNYDVEKGQTAGRSVMRDGGMVVLEAAATATVATAAGQQQQ